MSRTSLPRGIRAIKPFLTQYAGQQLLTGAQAEAYANHYIAVHLKEAAGGKTYSDLETPPLPVGEASSFQGLPAAGCDDHAYEATSDAVRALAAGVYRPRLRDRLRRDVCSVRALRSCIEQ